MNAPPKTWRCGHERTPENTHGGTERTHSQCLTCRRRTQAEADARYEHKIGGLMRRIQKDRARIRANARRYGWEELA